MGFAKSGAPPPQLPTAAQIKAYEAASIERSIADRIMYWGIVLAYEPNKAGRIEIEEHIKQLNHKLAEINATVL